VAAVKDRPVINYVPFIKPYVSMSPQYTHSAFVTHDTFANSDTALPSFKIAAIPGNSGKASPVFQILDDQNGSWFNR
jgi:hypothetical protein